MNKINFVWALGLLFVLASSTSVSPIAAQLEIPPLTIISPIASLSVESADMSGTTFEGMWVELRKDGILVQSGWTPFSTFVLTGNQYEVFIQNWEDIIFDHWEDGSTDQRRAIALTQDATLTAFFQTGAATTNNPPVASDDFAATTVNNPVTIDVLANDSDPDGDVLIIASATDGANGFVTVNADQTITYTPNQDFVGDDSFEYTINDDQDGFDTATVFVTVNPVDDTANNTPIANDDFAETTMNSEVTIPVLDNDFDPDGDVLIIASATDGANGFVTINEDQTITYTPNFDFVGDDSFEYTINDGQDGFDTATVFVTVTQ